MKVLYPSVLFQTYILCICFVLTSAVGKAQVTEIYTDYGSFWKSTTAANNPIKPITSHNLIGFKAGAIIYSTGVSDSAMTSNYGVGYIASNYRALPITSLGGTISNATSTYIELPSFYDGVANGYGSPLPALRIADVLTDGKNGLDISTGVTNVPSSASLSFPINNIVAAFTSSVTPTLIFSQIHAPSAVNDTIYFVNGAGALVGNKVAISWSSLPPLGQDTSDHYALSYTTCDAATVTGGISTKQSNDIRLVALAFSDFSIDITNMDLVAQLIVKPGGDSDPAFVAYNTAAFNILTPVILTQPVSQLVCPAVAQDATFFVTASGLALTYQWKKNGSIIIGANASSYTITNVATADAGSYEVEISNASGTVTSSLVYLNTPILSQPLPATQSIVTGNTVTLSVTAANFTGFQWQKDGTNISGATNASFTTPVVTTATGGSYTVNVLNSLLGGCADNLSNAAVIVPDTLLFSKSAGNLNLLSTWGVNTDGSGSQPADFTRPEHTFELANQSNAATGADLTIAGTLSLLDAIATITPGTTLNAGRILRNGTGTLAGSATSSLTVNGVSSLSFATGSQVLKHLLVAGGTSTLNTNLDITAGNAAGSLVVSTGATLITSDSLRLKSDLNGTAIIGNSGGTITGNATIERYMPARRAWRLMAAPITTANAPSINQAWQEGAASSTSDPAPGFGTHITGGTAANGFDQSPNNASNLKYYDGTNFLPVSNTLTTPVTQYPGYFFFVRGNRSYSILTTATTTTPLPTVIRAKGNVYQGTQPAKAVAATGFTLIGNPYACPIDFGAVVSASINIKNRFTVWDPSLGGSNGVGAYVSIDWSGSAYTFTPSAPSITSIIQSGQAFFVQSNDSINPGSLGINESHKTSVTSNTPFGKVADGIPITPIDPDLGNAPDPSIVINLQIREPDSTLALADGVLSHYNAAYDNWINKGDALKFGNIKENLGIATPTNTLSIERRKLPLESDTMKLTFTGIKNLHYQFNIELQYFASTGMQPILYDKYLNKKTILNTITKYPFDITGDACSTAADRFEVIFKSLAAQPVKFITINAQALSNNSIAVSWKVTHETTVKQYEIQRKEEVLDSFKTVGVTAVKNNAGTAAYQFDDAAVSSHNNYYRIKSVDASGKISYSATVNVKLKNLGSLISILQNPVIGNTISLGLQNIEKGKYQYYIINTVGQTVLSGSFNYNGQPAEQIKMVEKLAGGTYGLSVIKGNTAYKSKLIISN